MHVAVQSLCDVERAPMRVSCMVVCGSLLKGQVPQAPGPAISRFAYS